MLPGRLKVSPAPPVECQSIAEIACGLDNFSTLCAAVTQAGLGSALSHGVWTVFAPTNAAFEALPEGTLDAVMADNSVLVDLLLFHVVVNKKIFAADLRCQHLLKMGNDKNSRTVCRSGKGVDGIFQKGAGNPRDVDFMPEIITTDIAACNGIIHVVDNVLLGP
jgi:transforming growth factor-beta-induced protein